MRSLIGTWRLVDWTADIGSRVVRPFGGTVVGLLTYTDDGRMWAALMKEDRQALNTSSIRGADARSRASAAAGYISYAGAYTIDGDEVHHDVEVSLFPDWVGDVQTRQIAWVDVDGEDLLELSYVQPGNGSDATNTLRWRRIESSKESP
ncbi:MAG: lipocalin-like domain-containing protein [Acidimicrobiia bacterium]|nr:lipocalin-like domain-containing protein [Acidimicrobiia bacterium]